MGSNLVVKSNELNSIALFKNTLALKIFAKLIVVIRENENEEFFKISIKELFNDFKNSKEKHKNIKKTIKSMGMVEIGQQEEGFFLVSTFSKVKAENGLIEFKINEDLKPHIIGLINNFTSYYFENIAPLKSSFSIRIYEILKQWEKVGHKKFSITALRELLGIEETKYKTYNNFKRKVILVAQRELEEKTDIKFDFEEIKTGRKITDLHFYIKPNHKQNIITAEQQTPVNEEIKSLFDTLKISSKDQKSIIKQYQDEDLIKRNLKYTITALEKGTIKTSTIQYLRSALDRDYASQPVFNSKEYRKEKQQKEQAKEQELELLKADFIKKRDKKIFDYIATNKEQLGALFPEFIESNKIHFSKFNIAFNNYEEQQVRDLINNDNITKILFKSFVMKKIMKKNEYDFEEFLKTKK